MTIKTLEDIFLHELSDTYNAEKQMTKALPKMAKASTDPKLVKAFESHLAETEKQIERLDAVFEACNLTPKRIKCAAMEGLVEEGSDIISDVEEGPVRDAALVVAAQKVEHYEIAAYGSLVCLAKQLGYSDKAIRLLAQTLEEEKSTDEKLTMLAESGINEMAMEAAA